MLEGDRETVGTNARRTACFSIWVTCEQKNRAPESQKSIKNCSYITTRALVLQKKRFGSFCLLAAVHAKIDMGSPCTSVHSKTDRPSFVPKYSNVMRVSLLQLTTSCLAAAVVGFGLGRYGGLSQLCVQHVVDSLLSTNNKSSFLLGGNPPSLTLEVDGAPPSRDKVVTQCLHLIGSIQNVNGTFLDSENKITSALSKFVTEIEATMIHGATCYNTLGAKTCLATLSDGHVILRPFPNVSLLTFDLKICGSDDYDWMLTTVFPLVKKTFAVSDPSLDQDPHLDWYHKRRGYRISTTFNPNDSDIDSMAANVGMRQKELITTVQTDFQRVDVYEAYNTWHRDPSKYRLTATERELYQRENPEFFEKDKILLLDFVMQSRRHGDAPYHEALVHPALFTHENPRSVAIIGGGEGATLREVLKHKTVNRAVMVEIDEHMVNVSRATLPEWSDCSDLVGSEPSCFNDPRSEVYYEDAIGWFISRFADDADHDDAEEFDVIIMDALDPSSVVAFSDMLYDNGDLAEALSNALGDNGVFVVQLGVASDAGTLPEEFGDEKILKAFRHHLLDNGFAAIKEYEEYHCGFADPWAFMIAMKNSDSLAQFFANDAEVAAEIQGRILPTNSGKPALRWFDGATMATYQIPSRFVEDEWCLSEEGGCIFGHHGLNPSIPSVPESLFEIREQDGGKGMGVFARETIPEASYVGLDEAVQGLFVPPNTFRLLLQVFENEFPECSLDDVLDDYGWKVDSIGQVAAGLHGGKFAFLNHRFNGSEKDAPFPLTDVSISEQGLFNFSTIEYDPFEDRRFARGITHLMTRRPIQKGKQIMPSDLLPGDLHHEEWKDNLAQSVNVCGTEQPVCSSGQECQCQNL